MAWTDRDGQVWYSKIDVPAYEFIDTVLDQLDADAKTVILHTRYATKGDPAIEGNNHPIVRPGIVGVHNGVITNDDEVFDLLNVERYAQVDSEAAFALLQDSGMHPTEALTLLDGRVALSWLNTDDGHTLHVARVSGSPLAIGQSRMGTFVFASTLPMLTKAGAKAGLKFTLAQDVPEGYYCRVRNGIIHDTMPIGVPSDFNSALVMLGGE
jgi:glucosamine 6-phosphate synthetase-like amidotransferase/phosphosugar isomerase protein